MSRLLTSQRRRRVAALGSYLAVGVLLPMLVVTLGVQHDLRLSPLDEVAHLDYLHRARSLSMPVYGDRIQPEVARLAKCRSLEVRELIPCDDREIVVAPEDVAPDGYSYQAQHPPLYYWASAALSRVAEAGPPDNLITSGRLTGACWLSAGAIALLLALRRLSVGLGASTAAVATLIAAPGVVLATAKIGNDATAPLAGAALLLAYTFVRNRRSPYPLAALAIVAVIVVLLKPVNVMAVGAICLVTLIEEGRQSPWRRAITDAAVPAVASLATYASWAVFSSSRSRVDPDEVLGAVLAVKQTSAGLPIGQIIASSARLLSAYDTGLEGLLGEAALATASLGKWALLGVAAAAALTNRRSPAGTFATAALVTLVLGGAAWNLQFWLSYDLLGGPAPRYGLSVLPVLVAAVALQADRSSRGRWGLVALALLMTVVTITGIVLE